MDRFTIWAKHDRVKRWLPIVAGLPGPAAVTELTIRQDRLRRSQEPCRLVLLPDGAPAPSEAPTPSAYTRSG